MFGKMLATFHVVKVQGGELWIEQTEKVSETFLLARVRGRGDEDEVTIGVGRDFLEQVVALRSCLRSASGTVSNRAMCLINNHEIGTVIDELVSADRILDEVCGDDDERVSEK